MLFKIKDFTRALFNFSVETMNSIAEYFIDNYKASQIWDRHSEVLL